MYGHQVSAISAQISGKNEKKYSLTVLLNIGSAIGPKSRSGQDDHP
jgi:hypothetical protein